MTHMKDEALKSVLEVLKAAYVPADLDEQREKAITACEQALAAPVQEPVAWLEHLKQLASICPELNIVNYSDEDADDLNCWAIEVATYIDGIATPPAAQPATCTWTNSQEPYMPDTFNATCGAVWTFTDGGPVENDMNFCPKCGAAVSVAATEPEPEEDLFDLAMKADNGGQP